MKTHPLFHESGMMRTVVECPVCQNPRHPGEMVSVIRGAWRCLRCADDRNIRLAKPA